MPNTIALLFCIGFSSTVFAHDSAKIAELESRVAKLEQMMAQKGGPGLKTVNYGNQGISTPQMGGAAPSNKGDLQKLQKQFEDLKKQKQERDKYLEELMND